MLETVFEEILRLSLYGTIAGIGVLFLSLLIHRVRAARWISLVLWGLVALRLAVPFSVTSAASAFRLWHLSDRIENSLDFRGTYTGDYRTAPEGSAQYEKAVAAGSPVETERGGGRYVYYYRRANGTIEPAKTTYETVLPAAARIWLAGVAALWLWAAVSYGRLRAKLRFAMKISDGVYESDAVPSPCVAGILRPRIYLTPGLEGMRREHILLHERMHIRYLDHIWKVLSFLVVSLHWFNPVLWMFYRYFQGELERTCDERVLARLGVERKADYSESLLALAMERKWKMPTPIAFGEDDTKDRVKGILRYRKPLIAVSAAAVLIGAAVSVVLLTVPEKDSSESAEGETQITGTDEEDREPVGGEETDATTETDRDPDNVERDHEERVYEEIEENGVRYQARGSGIYRLEEDREELIYDGYAGINPQMTLFEGKLYFITDSFYFQGALDWANNAVRWVDLETFATGDLPLGRNPNAIIINSFYIRQGIIGVYYIYPRKEWEVMMLYAKEDVALNGKNVIELSDEEKQQYGQSITQRVLANQSTLTNISNRVQSQNLAYLDMDGDGVAEEIVLEPSRSARREAPDEPLRYYRLKIGEAVLEDAGYNTDNTLRAFSLDGKTMVLAIYEDGPSADPLTRFYRYENGQIIGAGSFETDILSCVLDGEGGISGTIFKEIANSDWIRVRWRMSADGMLEEVPQEVYDFTRGNPVELCEELPLHQEIGSQETFTVTPQTVKFLQTSADFNWLLIETADGQRGWVHVVDYEVVELEKNVMDVFEGGYLAG